MASDNRIPNVLEQLASVSYLWTLACLTKDEFNQPRSTYRNYDMFPQDRVVIASAGRFGHYRTPTAYGKQEYYIDNFEIDTVVTGNSDQGNGVGITNISFDVLEPHSMGLFIQSCQVAALKAGHPHYVLAPFVLKLDVVGFNDEGQAHETDITKYFTIYIINMELSVDNKGSKYSVFAVPASQLSYTDTRLLSSNSTTLRAEPDEDYTVETILKTGKYSLENELNKRAKHFVDDGNREIQDEYVIEFPDNTIGENIIKDATFPFGNTDGGIVWAMSENDDNVEDGLIMTPTFDGIRRSFSYNKNAVITQIITDVVLCSEFQKEALIPDNFVENDIVLTFLVNINMEIIEYDRKINDYAMRYIFNVEQYLKPLDDHAPNNPPDSSAIELSIVKEYNYWYTGQNTDVLKFEVQFNSLVKTFADFTHTLNNTSNMASDTMGSVESTVISYSSPDQDQVLYPTTVPGVKSVTRSNSTAYTSGGPGLIQPELEVAKHFYENVVMRSTDGDNIPLTLEIKGDPYWLIDHGFNNNNPEGLSVGSQLNVDNTVNYTEVPPAIYVTFKNPIDLNEEEGMYRFPPSGDNAFFTGVYYINRCKSFISSGVFKQELSGVRKPGQLFDIEYIGGTSSATPEFIAAEKGELPPITDMSSRLPTIN